MVPSQVLVGIDVAQAQLDIAVRPTAERWAVANDDAGIAALVAPLQAMVPTLIVREATGRYQRAVVAALAVAGWPVVVVNPRHARDFAKATGQDRWPRCPRLGALCRRRASRAASPA